MHLRSPRAPRATSSSPRSRWRSRPASRHAWRRWRPHLVRKRSPACSPGQPSRTKPAPPPQDCFRRRAEARHAGAYASGSDRPAAEAAEELADEVLIAPPGRRRAGDEIEHLAVLEAVQRHALYAQALIEVDGGDALVGGARIEELNAAPRALADVVPALVADGGHGRRRPERLQHLVGAHAGPDSSDRL